MEVEEDEQARLLPIDEGIEGRVGPSGRLFCRGGWRLVKAERNRPPQACLAGGSGGLLDKAQGAVLLLSDDGEKRITRARKYSHLTSQRIQRRRHAGLIPRSRNPIAVTGTRDWGRVRLTFHDHFGTSKLLPPAGRKGRVLPRIESQMGFDGPRRSLCLFGALLWGLRAAHPIPKDLREGALGPPAGQTLMLLAPSLEFVQMLRVIGFPGAYPIRSSLDPAHT